MGKTARVGKGNKARLCVDGQIDGQVDGQVDGQT